MRDHDHEHDQGLQIMIYEIMILIGARRSRWRDRRDHDRIRDRVDHAIDHAVIWISIL